MTPPKRLTPEREAEIRKALDQGNAWESDLRVCLSEIDALEAENEDLKVINQVLTNHSAKLESKLRSRLAKLREALKIVSENDSGDGVDEFALAIRVSREAIAQDDEEACIVSDPNSIHSGKDVSDEESGK